MLRRTVAFLPLLFIATRINSASALGAVIAVEVSVVQRTAEWVEKEITWPLERSLNKLPGLAAMKSSSTESLCLIELRFRRAPGVTALEKAKSVALATWLGLVDVVSEPTVAIKAARLG